MNSINQYHMYITCSSIKLIDLKLTASLSIHLTPKDFHVIQMDRRLLAESSIPVKITFF